ncbi:cyanophycin synthetase [Massilia arenosa]|uniref:Cyanophycin synthetase n=1 Tax=Zemynaea arenosa TaxID=2561931 RepID=A0A4Y9RVJ3_9BURK|nr:cyanophycin synthetase [Massilia arenosa]TFW11318.1 cyanophycin synthetase [Massilia arenosa]
MKITEQRYLRGPNLYANKPVLFSIVDLQELDDVSSKDIPGFTDQLLALIPSLWEHRCSYGHEGGFVQRLRDGTYIAHILEHVTLELQVLVGNEVGFGRARAVRGVPRHYRVVVAYKSEKVVAAAFDLARQLVEALAAGQPFDLATPMAQLKKLAERTSIGTSTGAVLDAARKRGIPYYRITEDANLFQLGWGRKQKRIQATTTGATNFIAVNIASDKQLTKALLEQAGVPVPQGECVDSVEEALRIARRLRVAVTVKPLDANQGKGVTTVCSTPEEVTTAYENARRFSKHVIVERYLSGRDYRVLVTGNRIAAASWRRPPNVVGDGTRSIRELVEIENQNPARGAGHTNILTKIPLDQIAEDVVKKQGYAGFDDVPAAGVGVDLRGNANLSTGGTAEDVTDLLPEETREICIRAARTIGLDVAGIDIICQDIAQPLVAQGGGIIEVNAAPGIRMHQYPSRGKPRDAGGAIVESLFGQDNGRIPVIAVTGTNGKTTTTLLAAHIARGTGLNTGVATTSGVYINGKMTMEGDCTGYKSARSLLTSPEVDIAVLETARGGIIKRGLAFDRCDVSIVLNVTDDHLGMDGIDSIEDLARVKGVVAHAASKAVVLNAEDDRCVAMVEKEVREGVEVLFFSLDPDNPVLLRHLERGGRAAYLQDSFLVFADGGRHHALLDVRTMPVSLNGLARYNTANALAATCAMFATGFDAAQIVAGLRSFVSDGKSNPLRSNVFDVNGVTVIVDYAHNLAAYAALAETARAMTAGQLVGIVAVPGDRRDQDIVTIGKACAACFDQMIVYETENRGRADGVVADLIMQGARQSLINHEQLHCRLDVHEAIRHGLSMCAPGDVLVFGCGSSLSELIEAVRPQSPEVAERLTVETT